MANRVRHSSGSPGAGGIFRRALFDRETRSGHRGNSGRSVPPRRGEQNESEGRAAVRVGSSGEVPIGFFVARSLTEKPAQDIAGIQVVPYRPAGASKMNPKDGLRYVWVPPGKFTMGCSAGDSDCFGDEEPAQIGR